MNAAINYHCKKLVLYIERVCEESAKLHSHLYIALYYLNYSKLYSFGISYRNAEPEGVLVHKERNSNRWVFILIQLVKIQNTV